MIDLISQCRFIISDSGGIQEEASFLKKKVIVCRKITERSETIGKSSFICNEPSDLNNLFYSIKDDYISDVECPYGDGDSSTHILNILKDKIYE
jgi:UDP-N-acetylglucosamine 2-epimerase (non-hydrolysing)